VTIFQLQRLVILSQGEGLRQQTIPLCRRIEDMQTDNFVGTIVANRVK